MAVLGNGGEQGPGHRSSREASFGPHGWKRLPIIWLNKAFRGLKKGKMSRTTVWPSASCPASPAAPEPGAPSRSQVLRTGVSGGHSQQAA